MKLLCETKDFVVRELGVEELPELQALFEANPGYFVAVNGKPPAANEAMREYEDFPPPHLTYGTRWFAGIFDRHRTMVGVSIVISDLSAKDVWHIALFFLDHKLRGTGAAEDLCTSIEALSISSGARWMRLGVIEGNHRAERFWSKCGYSEVRTRQLTNLSGEPRIVRVMVKPLLGGTFAEYLRLVPRDAPNSLLP
jgi:GNAT superfamily N-acetyltransferase